MKYSKLFILLCAISYFGVTQVASAASLYIDPAVSKLNRGDAISMAVRLDTDEAAGECVNAVDAVLTYSSNIEPVDISTGDSIFSLWVETPTINKEERTITFAGGVPNGYCGRVQGDPRLSNVITEIIFRSPGFMVGNLASEDKNATVNFRPENAIVYLNDGSGTMQQAATYGATIELSDSLGTSIVNTWQGEIEADNIPPAEFAIGIEKNATTFAGDWFISFNTSDKQTGIDHYEVIEEPISNFAAFDWGRADAPWTVQKSPYRLNDQTLNSIIRVKAVDKAGNEYISTLIPDEANRGYSLGFILALVVMVALGLLIVAIVTVIFIRFKNKRKAKVESSLIKNDDYDSEAN